MASVNVTIRMDADDKAKLEKLFSEFGLTMNAGFNMFAKQAIRELATPFKVTKSAGVVQYMGRNHLDKMLDDSEKKHSKVYAELGK